MLWPFAGMGTGTEVSRRRIDEQLSDDLVASRSASVESFSQRERSRSWTTMMRICTFVQYRSASFARSAVPKTVMAGSLSAEVLVLEPPALTTAARAREEPNGLP